MTIKSIKTWLIHKLGGVTERESTESNIRVYRQGRHDAFGDCIAKADEMFGVSADEWSEQMYKYFKSMTE